MKPRFVRRKGEFPLAHLLLRFWRRFDEDRWAAEETAILVKCDAVREQSFGIPSFLG